MTTMTYAVAVKDGAATIFAMDGSGESWSDRPVHKLDAAARDGAVRAAEEAGMPYEVIERTRHPFGHIPAFVDRHVAGTTLIAI